MIGLLYQDNRQNSDENDAYLKNRREAMEENGMNLFMVLAFLFFIGSVIGWILEVFFRRFFSDANPEKKWINPGFCTGPYLPLYGSGLCILFLVASLESFNIIKNSFWNKIALFVAMALAMTLIEYMAGLIAVKIFHVRLWDYSNEWGNIQGIICPRFSLFWAILSAGYYFFIHPKILEALTWLSKNLAFSFVIGLFFGFFIVDVVHSAQLVSKLKQLAIENDIIVRYENLKLQIRTAHENNMKKYHFFAPFRSDISLAEHLKKMRQSIKELRDGEETENHN